jgi:hypothetical protein
MNIAMGAKFLYWILVIGEPTWWKKNIHKKYFLGSRKRCLESQPKVATGSPIFKLLIATKPFICGRLNWIPGNGPQFNL